MEYEFTKENFEAEVLNSDKPVLVDFFAGWCGPCRMMAPVVAELAEEYGDRAKIGKVDTEKERELASAFRVMSIPTFLFIKNKKVAGRVVGGVPKQELKKKLNELL